MSVSNQQIYYEYIADGYTVVFPFSCRVIYPSDITVTIDGKQVSSYRVEGVDRPNGGNVVFSVAPVANSRVVLARDIPLIRETDYQTNGDFLAKTVNRDFDRLWMALQNAFIWVRRALRYPKNGTNYDAENRRIENLGYPVNQKDATTKYYVDQEYDKVKKAIDTVSDNMVQGFITVESFEKGATLRLNNQVLLWEKDGQYYRWTGALPKTVDINSTPHNSGGIGGGKWVLVGDSSIKTNIANTDDEKLGDAMLGVKQPFFGAIARTQHDKNADNISIKDFGAIGDGVTNEDAIFRHIEDTLKDKLIDLCGLTYSVTAPYTGNKYCNGFFRRTDGTIIPALYHSMSIRSGRYIQAIGQDALSKIAEKPENTIGTNLIAIGSRAMFNAVNVKNNYAIGHQSLFSMENGVYNTAFGFESLFSNNGTGDNITGSRNAAFGDNTLRYNTTGYNNIAIGRNAGQTNVAGNSNIHIGVASGTGDCPMDFNRKIVNTFPTNKNNCVGVGVSTLFYTNSDGHTAVGNKSLQYLKRGLNNTAVGFCAGRLLESNVSPTGKELTYKKAKGEYTVSNGIISVTQPNHGYTSGFTVKILFETGILNSITSDYLWLVINVTDENNYTCTSPENIVGEGTTLVVNHFSKIDSTTNCNYNTIVGYNALATGTTAKNSTVVGAGALTSGGKSDNTAIGFRALNFLGENGNQIRNTAIGARAMEFMTDGSECTDVYNSTAIGYQAYVSGSSQIQLGNSFTTPYAYQPLQLRSDIRDKTDIRDSDLGIDFILGLRPVRGRWNLREDYLDEHTIQEGTDENDQPIYTTKLEFNKTDYLAKTKKRTREHEWFIAQEVEALCKKMGVDFSGLHHASVKGGSDVYSLSYDSFIPPIVKAIQDCWNMIKTLEQRVKPE